MTSEAGRKDFNQEFLSRNEAWIASDIDFTRYNLICVQQLVRGNRHDTEIEKVLIGNYFLTFKMSKENYPTETWRDGTFWGKANYFVQIPKIGQRPVRLRRFVPLLPLFCLLYNKKKRPCSSVGLEHLTSNQGAKGSSPFRATIKA